MQEAAETVDCSLRNCACCCDALKQQLVARVLGQVYGPVSGPGIPTSWNHTGVTVPFEEKAKQMHHACACTHGALAKPDERSLSC